MKKLGICCLVLALALTCSAMAAEKQLPRKETLYLAGLLWGPVQNFNPLTGSATFPCVNEGDISSLLVYETLFIFNSLSGELEPLLGTEYSWPDEYTIQVKLNKAAHWSDGKPLTADDVVYTYLLGKKYTLAWSQYWPYLSSVSASADDTVVFRLNKDNYNRLKIPDSFMDVRILPKHVWEKIEAENNNDISAIRKVFNEDPVGSGPYKSYYYDDIMISSVRDDNYWGKALFGKLPVPKYIAHVSFKSNDAGNLALKKGDVDFSQQFIPQVWKMWKDGSPVRTYLKKEPYYIPGGMPHIIFNMKRKGLEKVEVRRAIALAVDYAKVAKLAMSGYSEPVVPGITLKTPVEEKYIDRKAVAPYEFTTDVKAANKLLDQIGAKKGSDGIRVLPDGTRLGPYDIECPFGWSDWNAAAEIVVQCTKKIGIEVRTKFPEFPVWLNDRFVGNFDMVISMPRNQLAISNPWLRAWNQMYSKGVPPLGEQSFWNYGRYSNPRADEILDLIPRTGDFKTLKKLYTELDIIYLKDLPFINLMYRPAHFFSVNESVWKGFPEEGDGSGIPPLMPIYGAGIRALYNISGN